MLHVLYFRKESLVSGHILWTVQAFDDCLDRPWSLSKEKFYSTVEYGVP